MAEFVPSIEILEQPAPRKFRFRYECENRSSGALLGVRSTSTMKTYPTIRVVGCTGNATIVVSLVTATEPYKWVTSDNVIALRFLIGWFCWSFAEFIRIKLITRRIQRRRCSSEAAHYWWTSMERNQLCLMVWALCAFVKRISSHHWKIAKKRKSIHSEVSMGTGWSVGWSWSKFLFTFSLLQADSNTSRIIKVSIWVLFVWPSNCTLTVSKSIESFRIQFSIKSLYPIWWFITLVRRVQSLLVARRLWCSAIKWRKATLWFNFGRQRLPAIMCGQSLPSKICTFTIKWAFYSKRPHTPIWELIVLCKHICSWCDLAMELLANRCRFNIIRRHRVSICCLRSLNPKSNPILNVLFVSCSRLSRENWKKNENFSECNLHIEHFHQTRRCGKR